MADPQGGGELLERGVRLLLDMGHKFLRIELAPFPPAGFGGERPRLGSGQIAINRAPCHRKAAHSLGLGTAGLKKLHHPFP